MVLAWINKPVFMPLIHFLPLKGWEKEQVLVCLYPYSIISDKHGGSICIADTSQDGTQFTIELPMEKHTEE